MLHLDLPRDSTANNDNDNDLTIISSNTSAARKIAKHKDVSMEESKANNKFQLNAKMLLASPLSEWINMGNNLSRQSSYDQCKIFSVLSDSMLHVTKCMYVCMYVCCNGECMYGSEGCLLLQDKHIF